MNRFEDDVFLLDLPDGPVSCIVRLSERARILRLRMRPDASLELVLPIGCSLVRAKEFAASQTGWIARTRRKMLLDQARRNAAENERLFPDSMALAYLGGTFSVQYQYTTACWVSAKCDPETRTVTVSGSVLKPELIRGALISMLKRSVTEFIYPHLEGLAAKFDFHPGQCTARIQKGRWGSCSSRGGAISLNAMLLFLDEDLVEYVLIHELCHLRHMDHSEAFWKEVGKYCPDYPEKRRNLRLVERSLPWKYYQNQQN